MDAEDTGEMAGVELVDWRQLPPGQRRGWWEQLWHATIRLSARYRLALRSGWWQDAIQVEALAAFTCWLALYDTGAETDPTGKLQLLWEIERLRTVLRAGEQAFEPTRDRPAFETHLATITHPEPLTREADQADDDGSSIARRRQLTEELMAVSERLAELRDRERILQADLQESHAGRDNAISHADPDLPELRRAVAQLAHRERDLRSQLGADGSASAR